MGDNQSLKSYLATALMNGERYAPTITRFIADHFSELVPPPDYFTRLVRDILNCYDEYIDITRLITILNLTSTIHQCRTSIVILKSYRTHVK